MESNSLLQIAKNSPALKTRAMKTVDEIRRENLAALIKEAGSQAELSKKTGKSASQISQWLNASAKSGSGKPRVMGNAMARQMEVVLGKPTGWMDQQNTRGSQLVNIEPGPDARGKVPLISWVQAGDWCHASEPLPVYEVERWMDCPRSHSNQTFVLRVRGDSMKSPHGKTYPEGCYIFVDGAMRSPVNGQHVVACLKNSGKTTFKVFKDEDGRQWLAPLNEQHPTLHEPFHILGTVIGKWEDV